MCRLFLLMGLAGLTGCSTSGSRNPDARPTSRDRGPANATFRADPKDSAPDRTLGRTAPPGRIPPAGVPTRNDAEGLLAGAVVDADGQRVPNAFIQVTSLSGSKSAKPIGVHADAQGYFSVPVRPGQGYELSVSVREQDRTLGASMIVQAPDAQVVLRINAEGVSSLTPRIPPPLGTTGPFAPKSPTRTDPRSPSASTWGDSPKPQLPKVPPTAFSHPENVAQEEVVRLPAASIPGPGRAVPLPFSDAIPPTPLGSASGLQPSAFSEAVKAGPFELELSDLQGKPWRFGDHGGKLVLLDFWGTWCPHCLKAAPQLRQLHREYGRSGLEIVAVACERDGTWDQQANAVARAGQKYEMDYGLYLDPDGKSGRAADKFGIKAYPTMVLLDRAGKVLYRGGDFAQLNQAIRANIR